MNKIITIILIIVSIVILVGCGSEIMTEVPDGIHNNLQIDITEGEFEKMDSITKYIESRNINDIIEYSEIEISKKEHKKTMDILGKSTQGALDGIVRDYRTPYIIDIDYNRNYRKIVVQVDREGFESAYDITTIKIDRLIESYNRFKGVEHRTNIKIIDTLNGETLKETEIRGE